MKLTKLIKVDNWFSRSINLERDKSSLDAVNAYVPTSTAIKTLRLIIKTLNNSKISRSWSLIGPYGSGKSSFGIFLNALFQPSSSDQYKLAINKISEIKVFCSTNLQKITSKVTTCFGRVLYTCMKYDAGAKSSLPCTLSSTSIYKCMYIYVCMYFEYDIYTMNMTQAQDLLYRVLCLPEPRQFAQ